MDVKRVHQHGRLVLKDCNHGLGVCTLCVCVCVLQTAENNTMADAHALSPKQLQSENTLETSNGW